MAIYKKLLEFQKQGIAIKKDGKNPHFKSSYPTLNEVLDKVKAPLNELGIVIIQRPNVVIKDEGVNQFGLSTILFDTEDDTAVECFMPYVEATTAQKLASSNTYNRRISLVTLLGLEDDDDDGNTASAPKKAIAGGDTKLATAFSQAKLAVHDAKDIEALETVQQQITKSTKLTNDQKEELSLTISDRLAILTS